MKIESINIKNFKGIEAFKGDVKGRNVYLIGGNETGKTSFIDAVWCGLTGKNIPPEPVKTGNSKGVTEIDLGDYIARTKYRRGKPAIFEIENKKATKETEKFMKAPRSFMEEKIGVLDFNINDFFQKSSGEQLKYFAKIMDADFSDIDTEIEENEDTRKFDKKNLKVLEGTLDSYDKAELEKESVNVVSLSKEIAEERKKWETFSDVENGIEERKLKVLSINAQIVALELERDGGNVIKDEENIVVKGVANEISDGENWLKDSDNIPLGFKEFEVLEASLENVNETNEKITSAKANKAIEVKIEVLENCIEENNDNISNLRSKKAKRISELINVEGLTYDMSEERFLYDGLPFDKTQINTAAQLIAGMKIGASTLKDLKILKVDASLIDKNNFEEVLAWAEKEQIELFIELVDREATQLKIHVDAEN